MAEITRVIIFDGICIFCNKSINFLIKIDKKKSFKYSPIQGKFVKSLGISANIDSIIFYENGTLYYKSTAILRILHSLGGAWTIVNIFYIIPTFIRDAIYDFIAKYRYKIFGKMQSCRIPNVDEKALFID